MATIKHLTSKNSNYAAAESYLTFQHNEYTGLPILDEKGRPKLRDSYLLDTLECGESSFAMACLIANRKYGKNGGREDVKTHHYIISFDPKDAVENGLTMERAQALGLQFCKDNFPGHPAIVCTHPDGHNSAGNIHVHIVIGSLRVRTVERQPFMDKPCDWEAGKKHRCTSAMLRHLRVAVMEMCEQADLNQINLLEAQGDHVSEREYWAQRRGQRRLDHANAKLAAEGQQPTQTVYQTELDKLRKQIYAVLNKTTTFEEFSALLMQEHGIAVKESRGRLSYCPPGRTKFITAKKLSKKLEKEQVLTALSQNIQLAAIIQPSSEKKPDKIRKLVDIQANVAAGKGIGYERWAKKFNLKRWSQTLCLLQEKKLLSEDALHQRIAELQTQHDDALAVVKDMDARSAGGDMGVIDLVPAGTGQVVFIAGGAVRVPFYAAHRSVFQMHDHRLPGGKLGVKLLQALGQAAGVTVVPACCPARPVRPHAAAGGNFSIQNGACIAQGVPAAFAGGLVADGKDLAGAEVQHPDAVRFLQGSCVCVGNGQSQHKAQRQNCRRQPLCRAGGTVLHIEPHPLFFLRPYFTMQKW